MRVEVVEGEAPPLDTPTEHLSVVVVGHVDHGKSTLLGRLYADTGSLPEGKLEKVQAICRQQGKEFEYAFLFDVFLEEQQQGVTIDTARTFFTWGGRRYVLIDAPGHKEFLKNMVSGAARAEAALLVIDAHEGVQEQSRRHGHLVSMLGVRQLAVVVNKMDLVGYRQEAFDRIEQVYRGFLAEIGVVPERFVPASARLGDNVAAPSPQLGWYVGPTVLETLAMFRKEAPPEGRPLRFPVQDVYKFDARRIIAGRISAGRLQVGDRLVFSPSNKSARVRTIEAFSVPPPSEAAAGQSIGVTLDEQVFVERGEVASLADAPPLVSTAFRCNLFWLGSRPLEVGRRYALRLATREVECHVAEVQRIIDAADLETRPASNQVRKNEVAELTICTKAPVAFDASSEIEGTGRFVLVDGYDVAGGGIVLGALADEQSSLREEARRRDLSWVSGGVSAEDRADRLGHRAALVLVAGPAEEPCSALARELERRLIEDGRHGYLLEAANLQQGLDADIGEADAGELVRRFGEVARLLLDGGLIVVSTASAARGGGEGAIRTLVHPMPVLTVRLGGEAQDEGWDLCVGAGIAPGAAADQVLEHLRRGGVLASPLGERQRYEYANYVI